MEFSDYGFVLRLTTLFHSVAEMLISFILFLISPQINTRFARPLDKEHRFSILEAVAQMLTIMIAMIMAKEEDNGDGQFDIPLNSFSSPN